MLYLPEAQHTASAPVFLKSRQHRVLLCLSIRQIRKRGPPVLGNLARADTVQVTRGKTLQVPCSRDGRAPTPTGNSHAHMGSKGRQSEFKLCSKCVLSQQGTGVAATREWACPQISSRKISFIECINPCSKSTQNKNFFQNNPEVRDPVSSRHLS